MEIWQKNLIELEERYKITDYRLLFKSFSVLVVIILLFFFSNFIPNVELELGGWKSLTSSTIVLACCIRLVYTLLCFTSRLDSFVWGHYSSAALWCRRTGRDTQQSGMGNTDIFCCSVCSHGRPSRAWANRFYRNHYCRYYQSELCLPNDAQCNIAWERQCVVISFVLFFLSECFYGLSAIGSYCTHCVGICSCFFFYWQHSVHTSHCELL